MKNWKKYSAGLAFALCIVLLFGNITSSASMGAAGVQEANVATESSTSSAIAEEEQKENRDSEKSSTNGSSETQPNATSDKFEKKQKQQTQSTLMPVGVNMAWESSSYTTNEEILNVADTNSTDTVRIGLTGPAEQPEAGYKVVIKYETVDYADTGFSLNTYTQATNLPANVENVVHNSSSKTVTYTLKATYFSSLGISLKFVSSNVFNQEKLKVSVKVYANDEDVTDDNSIDTAYLTSSVAGIDVKSIYSVSGVPTPGEGTWAIQHRLLQGGGTYRGSSAGTVTVDLADVVITVGTESKTYLEWLKAGNAPGIFKDAEGQPLKDNGSGYNTILEYEKSFRYGFTGSDSPYGFLFEKTSDFKEVDGIMPSIDFNANDTSINNGLGVTLKVVYQMRAGTPDIEMVQYDRRNDSAPEDAYDAIYNSTNSSGNNGEHKITARKPVTEANMSLNGVVYNNAYPYIQPDSLKYKGKSDYDHGYLYTNYLFRATLISERTSADVVGISETLRFTIPAGVHLTHIKLPTTGFTSVEYQGETYTPGDTIELDSPVTNGDISLIINELVSIGTNNGAWNGNTADEREKNIYFLGYTSGLADGAALSFKGQLGSAAEKSYNTTTLPDGKYYPEVRIPFARLLNSGGNETSTINNATNGTSFNLELVFAEIYRIYTDPIFQDPLTNKNQLLHNPVIYYSVPPGFDIGNVTLGGIVTSHDGTPVHTTEKIYENAGTWATEGGAMVEVKIHGPGGSDIFLTGQGNSGLNVRLGLTVSDNFSVMEYGKTFNFSGTAYVGTWGDRIASISGGVSNENLPAEHINTSSNVKRTGGGTINMATPDVLQVVGATRVNSGTYKSYETGNDSTMPIRPAGSKNEEFQFQYYFGEPGSADDAVSYFIVPSADTWRPVLNGKPNIITNLTSPYKIYYTLDEDALSANVSDMEPDTGELNYDWQEATIIGDELDIDATTLAKITAFKFEFKKVESGEGINMYMPYELTKGGGNIDYSIPAIGKTLYHDTNGGIVNPNRNIEGAIPAVKLLLSDRPVITQSGEEIPTLPAVVEHSSSNSNIPNWYEDIETFDDVNEGLGLDYVEISFIPQGKTSSEAVTVTIPATSMSSISYDPNAPDYVTGSSTELNMDPRDFINTSTPGTYTVTYVTEKDNDDQVGIENRTIVILKTLDSIKTTPSSISYFFDEDPGDVSGGAVSWDEVLRGRLDISDTGRAVPGDSSKMSFTTIKAITNAAIGDVTDLDSMSQTPGKYEVTYTYDDGYGNIKEATVVVTVKYRANITLLVTSSGIGVSGASVTVDDRTAKNTDANGTAIYTVEATEEDPLNARFTASALSVPNGLTMPLLSNQELVLDYDSTSTDKIVTFVSTPVILKAVLEDNDSLDWVESVYLYKIVNGNEELVTGPVILNGATEYIFNPKDVISDGSKWFDGTHVIKAKIERGYRPDGTGSEFALDSSAGWFGGASKTEDILIGNLNVTKTAVPKEGNKYTVTFYDNKDINNTFDTITGVIHGSTISALKNEPTRKGYVFVGWYNSKVGSNPSSTDKFDFNSAITTNTSVYAAWKVVENEEEKEPPVDPPVTPPVTPPTNPPVDPPSGGTDTDSTFESTGNVAGQGSVANDGAGGSNDTTTIGNGGIPLFGKGIDSWALMNLILAIAGAVLALIMLIRAIYRKARGVEETYDEEEDQYYEETKKSKLLFLAGMLICAVVGAVLFILTQDITLPMVLLDYWTIFHVVIVIAEMLFVLFAFKTKKEELDEEDVRYIN